MSSRKWRFGAGLLAAIGLVLVVFGAGTLSAGATQPPDHKVTICHRTNSDTNPYVVETPDIASSGYLQAGHNDHTGPIWASGMKADHDKWGDIIPPYDYGDFHYAGLNWTGLGQAILRNGCTIPAPAPTSVNTTVFDADSSVVWSGTEVAGASAYDTAVVVHAAAVPVATGSVTYTFYRNNTCGGTGTSAGTRTLDALGRVSKSDTQSNLDAGFYAFRATYSGDSVYATSTSECERFTVKSPPGGAKATVTTTTVFNAATNAAWSAPVQAPAAAYDTAKVVTPSALPAPTGTVTYTFFSNDTCATESGSNIGTKTIGAGGAVPNSDTKSGLAAGSYAFQATYSGDDNYKGSTSECEKFTVVGGPYDPKTTTTTTIFNASTNAALVGDLALNGSVYDTSVVTHVGGLTPTGTISYTFWSNNSCTGTGVAAGTNLSLGTRSSTKGPPGRRCLLLQGELHQQRYDEIQQFRKRM